jgi:hypothetical protein
VYSLIDILTFQDDIQGKRTKVEEEILDVVPLQCSFGGTT